MIAVHEIVCTSHPIVVREQPPEVYPPGRTCHEPGCSTVLSRYNGSKWCWVHGELNPRRGVDRFMARRSA